MHRISANPTGGIICCGVNVVLTEVAPRKIFAAAFAGEPCVCAFILSLSPRIDLSCRQEGGAIFSPRFPARYPLIAAEMTGRGCRKQPLSTPRHVERHVSEISHTSSAQDSLSSSDSSVNGTVNNTLGPIPRGH